LHFVEEAYFGDKKSISRLLDSKKKIEINMSSFLTNKLDKIVIFARHKLE